MKKWTRVLLLFCMIAGMTINVCAEENTEDTKTEITDSDVSNPEVTDPEVSKPEEAALATPVVQVKQVASGVKISWQLVDGATQYEVYRKVGNGKWGENPWFIAKQDYCINTAITYGKTYTYKVQAVNVETGEKSAFTEEFVQKIGVAKPENILVERDTHASVKLSWDKNKPATGYEIYRATSKNGTYKKVATISKASTTSYIDENLVTGKTYYYKMKAVRYSKKSAFSEVASGKVALIPPVMKKTSYVTSSSITVRWNESPNAEGYYVLRQTEKGTWKRIATVEGADTLSYKDKTAKGEHKYSVQSYRNVDGKVHHSNRAYSITAKVLKTPKLTLKQVDGEKKVQLTWTEVPDAAKYRIYKKTGLNGTWKHVKTVSADTRSYTAKIPTQKSVYWKIRATYTIDANYSYGAYTSTKVETIRLPSFITYLDMENSAYPSNEKTESILMGIVNIGKSKMRIYSKNAYFDDWDIPGENHDGTVEPDYNRNLYLADVDSGKAISYLDVAVAKGDIDEKDIGLPVFVVEGEKTRFAKGSVIEFDFRYDGLYYRAYVGYGEIDYKEIKKPSGV